jgi:hypothetical protein
MEETTQHLLVGCNYTKATWNIVAVRFGLPCYVVMAAAGSPGSGCNTLPGGSMKERRNKARILVTFWWMIWKERNKRIFDHTETSTQALVVLHIETILLHHLAWENMDQ